MVEFFYRRAFLNRPRHESSAHVIARVEMAGGEVRASIRIADCSRSVTLDLDLWEDGKPADRRNGLHKAQLLRDTVVDFVAALELAYAEQAERVRKR